jgi:hypothetical protein
MTQYTRRSFIKRAGSASLGTALGLGLVPSITNKLKAVDTSSGVMGVVMQLTSASSSATASTAYAGGTINAGVAIIQMPTAGTCLLSISVVWRRWLSYARGGATIFTSEQRWRTTWTCVNGAPSMVKQYLNIDGTDPAPGTVPTGQVLRSQAIVDASGANCGLLEQMASANTSDTAQGTRGVASDGWAPISPIIDTGLVSHSITCCPLAA